MIRPVEQALLELIFASLSKNMGMTNAKVLKAERKSERDFDVSVECTSDLCTFGLWIPVAAIRELTDWSSPAIAAMTDYPEMARMGDWSGVRDTERSKLWEIFVQHVPKVAL